MLNLVDLPGLWSDWRTRQNKRDERYAEVDAVVAGEYGVFDADEQTALNASPNFVETALSDTAEAASLMPTVRCTPYTMSDLQRSRASEMERIGVAYMGAWGADLLIPQTVRYLAKYGLGAWIIWPDFEQRIPLLEQRDPRTCYPEPGYRTGDKVRRCMFTRDVYFTSLPPEHLEKVAGWFAQQRNGPQVTRNTTVTLVEWFDADEYVLAAMMAVASPLGAVSSSVRYVPVELERIPNPFDHVPVILGSRITDGEFVGQFDQVLDLQRAHVRLAGLALDYADQSVYSDIWVRDLIGELSFGGGGFIELGPNGAIGRVPPAVSSMNVARDLQQLEAGLHMGARWPQSRPGEISQCLAPHTKVLTDDLRWIEVGELKVGDKIAGFDETSEPQAGGRKWRTATVEHVGRAVLPSYRVRLADGTEFIASEKHQWLVRNNARKSSWVTTDQLGKWKRKVVKVTDVWDCLDTYEAGYLAGFLDGEGSLSNPTGRGGSTMLQVAQVDNEALAAFEVYAEGLGFDFRRYESGTGQFPGSSKQVHKLHLRGGRREVLRALGELRPKRLLRKFADLGGCEQLGRFDGETVAVESVEFIGDHEVVTLGTSTMTLVAEGFAHHNSIASAKFLESAAGMMNTAIRTYHLILSQMFGQALQVAMEIDLKLFPGKKTVSGVLRNQQFLMEYDSKVIEPKNRVRAEYGIGLGRTASESAVLAIQYAQNGLISQELVQESIEGVTDIARERSRIDTEKLQGLLFAKMLQDVQNGALDDRALIEILRARQMGQDMVSLYEKHVLEPKEKAMQTPLAPPGAMLPGMPMGMQAPQGQPPVPQAPQPSQMTQRMIAGDRNASIMALGGA